MHMIARMQEIRIRHEPHTLPFQNGRRIAHEEDGCVFRPRFGGVLLGGFCGWEGGRWLKAERAAVAMGCREGADWGEGFGGVEDEVWEGGHDGIVVEIGIGRWLCGWGNFE
jgi:hypothetical protein